jgi:hypothetical protein
MGKLLQTNVTSAKLIPEAIAVFAMGYYEKVASLEHQMTHRWKVSGAFDSTEFLYKTVRKLGYRSPLPPDTAAISEDRPPSEAT